ncbi:MAG: cysteine dioxygenase family protein [Roseitalea porphyridii]|jgi:predicted metal-dependent enzyme (double-stranded beta helix superfamily)|uniref:cysteine dioxygenase n=1 Tax=Roseitalea porphyridii TaxID=1852022 RepID=UPI0032EC54D0
MAIPGNIEAQHRQPAAGEIVKPIADLDNDLCRVELKLMQNALVSAAASVGDLKDLDYLDDVHLGRSLLWGPQGTRFSLWAFRWKPGAVTPVHDHHCACAFIVQQGFIEERMYARSDRNCVAETGRVLRGPGEMRALSLNSAYIHSMHNLTDVEAYSIHLYAFDPAREHSSVRNSFEPM